MKQFLIGLFQTLFGLLAVIIMIPLVFFIKRDEYPSYCTALKDKDPFDPSYVRRGDLRIFRNIFQTMDMRFPGGMYEPSVAKTYGNGSYLRFLLTSYQWAGLRNRAQGLAQMLGKRADNYIQDPFDTDPKNDRSNWDFSKPNNLRFDRASDGVWKVVRIFGGIRVEYGYQVYKLANGNFWAVNLFTIRLHK